MLLLFAPNFALANLTDEAQTMCDALDKQTAAKFWQKARGCVRIGFLYQSGRGVKQDDEKAGKFYQKACDADELSGCDSLASLHQNSGEHAKAAAIFKQACEKGFGLSCYNLAQIYEAGSGVAPDESKALDLYVKACERGYAVVCYYLGGMYADGWASENDEAAKNSKNALKFYSLGCEGKIYEACEALGRLYEDGKAGFAQDIKAAGSYYDKACAANAYKCEGSQRLDELQGGWTQYQSGQFEAAYELGKSSATQA
nr:tetratricopeptide repeat protein [uncultured Campylobacter sp.]